MTPLPPTPELCAVAQRVIWFEPADQALADPVRFLAYLMTYGTPADIAAVRRYVGAEAFSDVLAHPPAGILDARSWAYWHAVHGRYPAPPLPQRVFP